MIGFHEDEARSLLLAALFVAMLALGLAVLMPGAQAAMVPGTASHHAGDPL